MKEMRWQQISDGSRSASSDHVKARHIHSSDYEQELHLLGAQTDVYLIML